VLFGFFFLSGKKFAATIIFLQRLSNPLTKIEMEEKMKKTDSMLSFLGTEVNINIDFTANVNLDKRGGGGATK
jgi:hypothetical protein